MINLNIILASEVATAHMECASTFVPDTVSNTGTKNAATPRGYPGQLPGTRLKLSIIPPNCSFQTWEAGVLHGDNWRPRIRYDTE